MERLTQRQQEVIELLNQGLSVNQVAEKLNISARTVESHVDDSFTRMGLQGKDRRILKALALFRECREKLIYVNLSIEKQEKIVELVNQGLNYIAIAERLNVSFSDILSAKKKLCPEKIKTHKRKTT